MDACIGCTIPIYYGKLDETDKKIFNENRILFYDPFNQESLNCLSLKIKEITSNMSKLIEFYKQPIFCNNAYNVILQMEHNLIEALKKFC